MRTVMGIRAIPGAVWLAALCLAVPARAAEPVSPVPLTLEQLGRPDLAALSIPLPEARFALPGAGVVRESETPPAGFRTGVLLVKFRTLKHVAVLRVHPGEESAALSRVADRADVAFAEPDRMLARQFQPSDPLLGTQWHHAVIHSVGAWAHGLGSHAVRVAIVDRPFQMNHPDLSANTVSGWDVVNEVPIDSDAGYGDDGHATQAAGMAAAAVNNALGVAGAGNCAVLPIHINGFVSDMYKAVVWAAGHGVRVVSISWDGANSPTLEEAGLILLQQADGVLVMSGVNGDGRLEYTNFPHIVCVSMTDNNDALRSKYGPHIDFAAPGYSVQTTTLGAGYGAASGTSFSTPLVAGIFAVLFSDCPGLTAEEAVRILRISATDLGEPGWDARYGWGRVDFGAAAWLAAARAGAKTAALRIAGVAVSNTTVRVMTGIHPGLDYTLLRCDPSGSPRMWQTVSALESRSNPVVTLEHDLAAPAGLYRIEARLKP